MIGEWKFLISGLHMSVLYCKWGNLHPGLGFTWTLSSCAIFFSRTSSLAGGPWNDVQLPMRVYMINNVSAEHLKWCPMLQQMRESMICAHRQQYTKYSVFSLDQRTLCVISLLIGSNDIVCDQSSDWFKWHCVWSVFWLVQMTLCVISLLIRPKDVVCVTCRNFPLFVRAKIISVCRYINFKIYTQNLL